MAVKSGQPTAVIHSTSISDWSRRQAFANSNLKACYRRRTPLRFAGRSAFSRRVVMCPLFKPTAIPLAAIVRRNLYSRCPPINHLDLETDLSRNRGGYASASSSPTLSHCLRFLRISHAPDGQHPELLCLCFRSSFH
jgi:hypothetical protein